MQIFADLHNHSKYSRATSGDMDLEHQSHYGEIKGLNLLGTGDFTHPLWFKELKEKLKGGEEGIYNFKNMGWILSAEISNIYSTAEGVKKIHHILLAPNFEVVEQVNELLSKRGNLKADGRPIFGKYPSDELVNDLKKIDDAIEIIPAHIWTPWFSLFGSNSGYNNIKDCYKEQLKHIHCLETGLSSDPEMNWRVSQTNNYTLVSNSDSHSPHPWRIGRECNVFSMDTPATYETLIKKLRTKQLDYTIEVSPSYGKYHLDGHRNCNICLRPEETKEYNGLCPKCKKPLTIGVLNRVNELTDEGMGFRPENAVPFKTLLPLAELLRVKKGLSSLNSKTLYKEYETIISHFGNEFNILLNISESELKKYLDNQTVKMIIQNRNSQIRFEPEGYDGVYGEPKFETEEKEKKSSLKDFF